MATYLTETANTVQLSTVADVLHRGRESFPFRTYVVADTPLEAATKIGDAAAELSTDMPAAKKNPRVIFMFPGQGSHYLNMARKLHAEDPVFRRHFDACADTVLPLIGSLDIREVLTSHDASLLDNPCAVQLAIFATEYAMAKLLMHCGVRPTALAGHSIGEYAASVIGGILPLHVALRMIAVRATTVRDACPRGGMLTAPLSPAEADAFATDFNARHLPVDAAHQLSVAAYNGLSHVVFSGPLDVCKQAEVELCARKLKVRQLHVTNAFHSPSLQPAATAVAAVVKSLQGDDIPAKGVIPVTSNVTGEWMSEEVKGGDYWAEQIVGPVHWTQNVAALMRWHPECFVEVGPGNTLGFFVNTTLSATKADGTVFSTMRHAKDTGMDDVCAVLSALGGLWSRGVVIDWDSFHENSLQARDPFMPTYAWDEQSFWQAPERSIYVDPPQLSANSGQVQTTRVEVDWLVRYARPHAMPVDTRDVSILLYCFPYAGGSSRVFETWAIRKSTPPWLDIVAVEPAQRGVRADEETRRSSIEEIEIITILIRAELDAHPEALWALCGFSKGALAAVEVAAKLTRDGYVVFSFFLSFAHASHSTEMTCTHTPYPSVVMGTG
jgi:acyl transferase domain-containing protein